MYHVSLFQYVLENRTMTLTVYLALLISSLLYLKVASDYSFLQMENLDTYTHDFIKIYDTEEVNSQLDTSKSIKNFFAKVKNYTIDLEKIHVNLRVNPENTWFSLYKELPEEMYGDLDKMRIATRSINAIFELFYIDFLDGFYTSNLIQNFISISLSSTPGNLYENVVIINNIIFPRGLLESNEDNFFGQISEKFNKNFTQLCKDHHTQQQFLISLYSFIIRTQFRAFVMMTSAHKLRSILLDTTSINYLNDIKQLRIYFLSKCSFCLEKMQRVIAKTTTEYYNCQAAHEYNYDIENVYAVDLSPIIVDYKRNKVVTGIQFEIKDGLLSLVLYDGMLLENGKISTPYRSFGKHYATHQHPNRCTFLKNRRFDYQLSDIESVDESFWDNISFLDTKVPENHVVIGANFEILKFDTKSSMTKKILYLRLHCAKINIKTGKIDTSSITYTKTWTKDDLALKEHPEITKDHSFRKSVELSYYLVEVNVSNSVTEKRLRRKPPLSSFIDSSVVQVSPPLPLTGISIWKNTHQQDSHYLSLKISTINISSYIEYNSTKYFQKILVFE